MASPTPSLPTRSAPVELRDPWLAGFLAWFIPGAGHLYQGRVGKGILFAVCILGTFFYGQSLGGWDVVYLRWDRQPNGHRRWAYFCQLGTGAPAVPALVQFLRMNGRPPPERQPGQPAPDLFLNGYQAVPTDQQLNERFNRGQPFELGTVYTMVAGLLNILVIFDAAAGPAYRREDEQDKEHEEKENDDESTGPDSGREGDGRDPSVRPPYAEPAGMPAGKTGDSPK